MTISSKDIHAGLKTSGPKNTRPGKSTTVMQGKMMNKKPGTGVTSPLGNPPNSIKKPKGRV